MKFSELPATLIVIYIALILSISQASAGVYKCTKPSGGTVYSDRPCPGAQEQEGDKWVDLEEKQRREAALTRQKQRDFDQRIKILREQRTAEEEAKRNSEAEYERERESAVREASANGRYVIEYIVDGTAHQASLTYNNSTGGTEQHNVSLPWRKMMTVRRGYFAYISAQNKNAGGDVSVSIHLNGIPVKSSRSSAKYGIASASGKI